jgi:hypothetical protein
VKLHEKSADGKSETIVLNVIKEEQREQRFKK